MSEINLSKEVGEKIKDDFNILSKVFHKRLGLICYPVRYIKSSDNLKMHKQVTASLTLILRYVARLNKKQTNFFFKYVIVKD